MKTIQNYRGQFNLRALLLLVAVAVAVAGCGERKSEQRTAGGPEAEKGTNKKITITQFGDLLLYLPLYIASDEGLFAKQGLDVRIVSTGGDDKTYAAVISGSAQFGLADPTFVAIAREKGQKGKVVAMLINGMPNYGVSLTTDKPVIKKPDELRGMTVATAPAPSTSYAVVKKLYEQGGLPPAIRQVAPSALVPTLQAGEADYALLIEPWVSAVVQRGGRVAFSLMDYYPEFALTGLTCSQTLIDTDPETARKVLLAMTEAVGLFYANEDLAMRVAMKRFVGEKPDHLKAGIQRMRDDKIYPRRLTVTERAWQPAVQLRRDSGDLSSSPLPFSDYVDNSFSDAAATVLKIESN